MAKPQLQYLSREELGLIHRSSLKILSDTGVNFGSKQALEILAEAGCKVDPSRGRVWMQPRLIEEMVAKAPKIVELKARDARNDIVADGSAVFYGTISGSKYIIEAQPGRRRPATMADLANILKVINACDNITHLSMIITPQDVPPESAYYHSMAVCLKGSAKHVRLVTFGAEMVKDALRIGSLIAGGEAELRARPFFSFMELTVPPLSHDPAVIDTIIEGARNGFPIWISSGPCSGATSPVTLAGTLAMVNAEVLSSIALVQLLNPGNPVIYGSFARIMDMRTGQVSLSSPEWCIMRACVAQMARRYGLPCWGGNMINAAKLIDAQAGFEKTLSSLMCGLAGLTFPCGMLMDSQNGVSFEDLVVNNEIIAAVLRILRGFEVDERTLALDLIDQVGPGGVFLETKHTLQNYRSEIWRPELSERRSWDEWAKDGAKDISQRAREKVAQILAAPDRLALDREVCSQVDSIIAGAEKKLLR